MTTLFAVLMLAVWIYIASCFEADSFQNLYVNRVRTLLFRPVTAVERLLPRAAPEWAAPAAIFAALLALASIAPRAAGIPSSAVFGARLRLSAACGAFANCAAMQAGAFLILVAKLSTLRILMSWRLGPASGSSPLEFLETATWPLPHAGAARFRAGRESGGAGAMPLQIVATAALFLAGSALALGAARAQGAAVPSVQALALAAAIDSLLLLRGLLFFFCICSFFGFSGGPAAWRGPGEWMNFLGTAARDWLGDIVRATVGRDLVLGAVGFAPLLLFFAIGFLHPVLASLVL